MMKKAFLFIAAIMPAIMVRAQTLTVDASKVLCRVEPLIYGAGAEDVNHEIYGGLYDQKIFGEGFEEPALTNIKDFKAYDEQWQVASGMAVLETSRHGKLIYEGKRISNATVEVEVRMDGINAIAGLIVGVSNAANGADAFNGYEVALNARKGSFVLGKHQQNWQPVSDTQTSFNPLGEWNKLRVVINGAKLSIYLNDNLLTTYQDTINPLRSGFIGLRSYGGSATFRGLVVDGMPIPFENDAPNVSGMWTAIGEGEFVHDKDNPFTGKYSQKIKTPQPPLGGVTGIYNQGLNQWGISYEKDKQLHLSLYLRGNAGKVSVALQSQDGSKEYARKEIEGIGAEWKRFDASLKPSETDPAGRFCIELAEEGSVWIDQVLLSTDSYPFRSDLTEAFRQEHLTFLRYGGTMVNAREYMTKNMTGSRLEREPYYGHWYRYATNGFAIPEFVAFARLIGTEPTFSINIEDNPQDVIALQPSGQNDNGWDQGQIFFSPSQVWMQPPYYAQQMAAMNHQPLLVESSCTLNTNLDYTATRNERGDTLVLHVVNYNTTSKSLTLNLMGFGEVGSIRCHSLSGTLNGENTLVHPTRVVPVESSVTPGEKLVLKANSYTVFVIESTKARHL